MVKKTLAVLLLVSLQVQAAPTPEAPASLTDSELEFFSRNLPASANEIVRRRKCKCFECLKATCAVIQTLAVTGNETVNGTLTVAGVSVNNALTIANTFAFAHFVNDDTDIAGGVAVPFDSTDAISTIIHSNTVNPEQFTLPAVGTYHVQWVVPATDAAGDGQLELALNGTAVTSTVVGQTHTDAGDSLLLVGNALITTTTANSVLTLINPAGQTTLTLSSTIGQTGGAAVPVSSISIQRIS